MNNLEKQVLQIIGEDENSPDVFLDTDEGIAPIRESINDAIEEISILSGSHKRSYALSLVEGQSFYRLKVNDGEIAWITDAVLVTQKRRLVQTDTIYLTNQDPRWLESQGTPEFYIPIGKDVLGVYPRPGGTTDIIDLTCVMVPSRYTSDTDRIKLLENFKRAVVNFAVSEYWASRGSANDGRNQFTSYLEIVGMRQTHPEFADRQNQMETK